ncbi:MAG: RNA methyltransferase [Gemmatimonadetes bacterium]|nr:RNA methyltransferase [Gemmatimonadota bacterium]MYD26786.1 RNA methyltransferase [Gemmatimonadota bacterium]MYI98420.1 RNA methyltransferase [Gemmatimonadota bacterium]
MVITSLQNPRIKAIRALSQRKRRQETGLFFAEGIRLVGEAVQTGADVETLVVALDLLRSDFGRDTVRRAREEGVEILEVGAEVFRTLSGKDGPAGIGVVARQRWTALDDAGVRLGGSDASTDEAGADGASPDNATAADTLGWVVLEDVGNPGNLGSILRTSEAVGGAGVILLGDTVDPYDPASVRGSMGAVFSQQIVRSSLESLIQWKRQVNIPMIGTSDATPADFRSATYAPPLLLCLGGEQHGLSNEVMDACDTVVRIPMAGRADSLNLAVAAGVMLYEVLYRVRDIR